MWQLALPCVLEHVYWRQAGRPLGCAHGILLLLLQYSNTLVHAKQPSQTGWQPHLIVNSWPATAPLWQINSS